MATTSRVPVVATHDGQSAEQGLLYMTPEEIAAAAAAAAAAKPPTFTDEQQSFIQNIIDGRIGKTKAQHAQELKAANDKVAELEAAIVAAREAAAKGGSGVDPDKDKALQDQMKSLLDAEKAKTQAAMELANRRDGESKSLAKENRRILKAEAVRQAAESQEGFSFVDMNIVRSLVDNDIHFDEETKGWVVKKENIVLQNASLQPMSIKEYLAQFAAKHPFLVNGQTKGGTGSSDSSRSGGGIGTVTTKADLKTTKDKSGYINKFGYQAFADLPAK